MEWEYADDVMLTTGAGTLIDSIDIRVQQLPINPFVGSVRLTLYEQSSAGGIGAAFSTLLVPAPSALGAMDMHFDFPDIAAPTGTVWVGWSFVGTGYLGVFHTQSAPSIGATTNQRAYRSNLPGTAWTMDTTVSNEKPMLRVVSVPGPGGVGVCVVAWLGAARRRR